MIAAYADVCDMIRLCDSDFNRCRSHMEQLGFISRQYDISFDKEEMGKQLERISFSQDSAAAEELEELWALIRRVRKRIWKTVNLRKKLALCKR